MVSQKQKRIYFSKKRKGMVEGEHEWLGYWSIVHLPSLLLVLNFVCSLGQGRFFPVILWLTFVPFFVLLFLFDEWYHVAAFLNLMCLCCQAIGWA